MPERPGFLPPPRTKPAPQPSAHPWILRVIVGLAAAVVVAGVVWASVLGHLL
jgi:hypothetical protein